MQVCEFNFLKDVIDMAGKKMMHHSAEGAAAAERHPNARALFGRPGMIPFGFEELSAGEKASLEIAAKKLDRAMSADDKAASTAATAQVRGILRSAGNRLGKKVSFG